MVDLGHAIPGVVFVKVFHNDPKTSHFSELWLTFCREDFRSSKSRVAVALQDGRMLVRGSLNTCMFVVET